MVGTAFTATSREISPLTGECELRIVDLHGGVAVGEDYRYTVSNPTSKKIVIISCVGVETSVGSTGSAVGVYNYGTTGISICTSDRLYLDYVLTYTLM